MYYYNMCNVLIFFILINFILKIIHAYYGFYLAFISGSPSGMTGRLRGQQPVQNFSPFFGIPTLVQEVPDYLTNTLMPLAKSRKLLKSLPGRKLNGRKWEDATFRKSWRVKVIKDAALKNPGKDRRRKCSKL